MTSAGAKSGSKMQDMPTAAASGGGRFSSDYQPEIFKEPGRRFGSHIQTKCPHCRAPAKVRSSKELTPLFKELRLQCTDLECGHTFVASLTIDRTIAPSARPNPSIRLPIGHPRPTTPANDD